jgi:hypothetical protein
MTDRELLELAAKAAGINTKRALGFSDVAFGWQKHLTPWNPLTDDGNAFHLMSKLKLDISYSGNWVFVSNDSGDLSSEQCNDDPSGATRLAIVKAAAEIGKSL